MKKLILFLIGLAFTQGARAQFNCSQIKTDGSTIICTGTNRLQVDTTKMATKYYVSTLGGSGTVTNVASGYGISGGPITTTGTLIADTGGATALVSKTRLANTIAGLGTGTVTSIATGLGISGGPITTTGTILIDTSDISILSRQRAANTYAPISITGTVTNIATGYGLSGGAITTTGTLIADTGGATALVSKTRLANTIAGLGGTGTVTNIATGLGISGGPITTTGTILIDTSDISILSRQRAANTYAPISITGTVTSVTAGFGTSFTTITTTGSVKVDSTVMSTIYYQQTHNSLSLMTYAALGSTVKAEPIGATLMSSSSTVALANGIMRFIALYLPYDATITGVKYFPTVASNGIETGYNGLELFSYSGGTLTMIDSTTRDTAAYDAALAWKTKAFPTTHVLTAGLYFIGVVWNRSAQTTAPTLLANLTSNTSASVYTMDFTNSAKINGTKAAVTAPITSQAMSGLTGGIATTSPYIVIY